MYPEQGLNILKCKCKAEWRGDSQCEGTEPLHMCPLFPVQSAQRCSYEEKEGDTG